jgi:DNA-binding GntR family transcriptional regulator
MMAREPSTLVLRLTALIAEEIGSGRFAAGQHLTAQALADRFGVSRSPIARALQELTARGVLRHEDRRGYFVQADPGSVAPGRIAPLDPVQLGYRALAEDRLDGRLPKVVSLALLRDRYRLSQAQVQTLVSRVMREGWMEQRAGYGLQFTEMLTSADALMQTYRFRMSVEPAALLEPGYRLDAGEAAACRKVEEHLLAGGVVSLSMEELYDRGVRFHELIVAGSGNPFFLDALRRINGIRRLLAYRSAASRERYVEQARDHLEILGLLEAGRQDDAAQRLRLHLGTVIRNLSAIRPVLEPNGPD